MSEQQRLFAAIALSLGIFLVWQYFIVPPPKAPHKAAPVTVAAPVVVPPAAPATLEQAVPVVAPTLEAAPTALVTFATPLVSGTVSSERGALVQLDLSRYLERGEAKGTQKPVSLVPHAQEGTPAGQAVLDVDVGGEAVVGYTLVDRQGTLVLTRRTSSGVVAEVQITPRTDAYVLDYVVTLHNDGPEPATTRGALRFRLPVPKEKGSMFSPQADIVGALCDVGGSLKRLHASDLETQAWLSTQPGVWGGLDRQYFVVAAVATDAQTLGCEASATAEAMTLSLGLGEKTLAAGERVERKLALFVGPKRQQELERVSPLLAQAIDYNLWGIPLGFLSRPMVFLLNTFHGWTASWGMAIMLLTLLVKLILFPVTYKSAVSMRRMQLLKPEMDKLKVRFEGDRERQQVELMKLYREKGVNPFGGCLPMLMQMPVWFALYRTLWTAVDLYQQSFLWVPDLTAKEPFPIMALVLGALTFVQQKLTPTPDSQQAKIMLYVMPVMLTVFMIALPSGLVLYILVNSVLTIAQQLVINRRQVAL